jgi:D-alanine-D-alanine ligase
VSLVKSLEELPQALTYCFHHDAFGVIEPYVAGTEWTVSMIDKTVLPPIRIETNRAFFDFHAKYEDENTRHIFPSDVSAKVVAAITAAGQRACESIGTNGLVRADLMVDRYSEPWVLEVNTIPGLTSHSLLPKAAAHAGICFEELCEIAIQSALSHAGVTFPSRRKIA